MKRTAVALIVAGAFNTPTMAEAVNCRAIQDSLDRLRCHDSQTSTAPATAPAPDKQPPRPAAPTEDPFITRAKARLKQQLRDPDSARYQNIKIKTVAGKRGLCGDVNAKNAMGGMTGFNQFAYDGEYAYVFSSNPSAGNPTSFGADIWEVTLGSRLKAQDIWCK